MTNALPALFSLLDHTPLLRSSAQPLSEVATPALLLDRRVLESNLDRAAARAVALGVRLRPHLKTAKCAAVAELARRGPVEGFTVSTLKEAAYFFEHGCRDLYYAVPIEPGKFGRAAALLSSGCNLAVACDHPSVAIALARAGAELAVRFAVKIEIDSGEHRSGVDAESGTLLEIAGSLRKQRGAVLRGVSTHGGHSYAARTPEALREIAEQERAAAVRAAERLRAAGFDCPMVSVGSSPTMAYAAHLRGVTELRCGVYMFGDLFQAGIGAGRRDDIAVSVLTAVIGHRPENNILLIDAGALALSKDVSTQCLSRELQAGYGVVTDLQRRELAGWRVSLIYQEHGLIAAPYPIDFSRYPIGCRVRILPNHSCITAAAYDRYHVVDANNFVVGEWPRVYGW